MKNTIGKICVVVGLVAVLGGLTAWLLLGDGTASADGSTTGAPPVTAPVTKGTIKQTITGAGEVKASASEKLKPAKWRYFGSFDAPLNKRIPAGDPLMTYTNGEVMTAPYDLVVTSYAVPKSKEALSQDDHYVEVQRIDTVSVTMPVFESDLGNVAEGQAVSVKLGADESDVREGIVANINEVGTYGATGSKFTVTVSVPNDGTIKIGMSANLSIAIGEAADVLTVPVSAVSGEGDAKYVEVYEASSGERRVVPVTTGITDGALVEVSGEGISEGDAVVLNEAPGSPTGELAASVAG